MVDKSLRAMNLVSAAIQRKKVAEEGETVVKTNAFYMSLKRSHKDAFNISAYTIKNGSDVRVNLPRPNAVVENLKDDAIDIQVNITACHIAGVSFPTSGALTDLKSKHKTVSRQKPLSAQRCKIYDVTRECSPITAVLLKAWQNETFFQKNQ